MNRNEPKRKGWALVTGANRGLGLEFTRQLLAAGHRVAACCRNPDWADDLRQLGDASDDRLAIRQLDLADPAGLCSRAESLRELAGGIDLLVHNAGIFADGEEGLVNFRREEMLRVFQVNLFGPLALTRDLLPALCHGAKVSILTSRTGALRPPTDDGAPGGQFSYPCSKAAVHRLVPTLADDLRPLGIAVAGIDPGWVRTGMTEAAPTSNRYQLEPEQSVGGMLKVIESLDLDKSGRLWRWNRELSNWYAPEETADERQESIQP